MLMQAFFCLLRCTWIWSRDGEVWRLFCFNIQVLLFSGEFSSYFLMGINVIVIVIFTGYIYHKVHG